MKDHSSIRRRSAAIGLPMPLATAALCAMLGGAISLAGCGGGGSEKGHNDSTAQGHAHPEGSSAEAAADTTGDHHHDEEAGAHTHSTRLEFAAEPAAIAPGASTTWTLTILDAATGKPVEEFERVHEKLMHLIVVSRDLTWFNHIHPEYKGNGRFVVTTTLPREGSYKLYADYTPKGKTQEVAQHEFASGGGATASAPATPDVDTPGDGGWIVRTVMAAPEGEPEKKGGDQYQVALMPMPRSPMAGKDVMLHFQVRDANGKPVAGLEPYLGAMGHAVLLSSDASIYLHTHPMEGGEHGGMDHGSMGHGGMDHGAGMSAGVGESEDAPKKKSDVMFHTNFPKPGLYKVWGQFQHKGKIVTAPFVLKAG